MRARDELAALLRTIEKKDVVPGEFVCEQLAHLVRQDRVLARFALDVVSNLIEEHEDLHGKDGALDCDRCTGLEDVIRELERAC